ncbi:hypothetical protein FO519_000885 [Halicephalobus sp. NKZ332]|nr:hypothetical protein FO519_000885 [Halicephalobus sp. NKZ332]
MVPINFTVNILCACLYICYFGQTVSIPMMIANFLGLEDEHASSHLFMIASFCNSTFLAQIYNCFWMIGAERLVATIRKGHYENCQNPRTMVFAGIITWGYSVMTSVGWHIFGLGSSIVLSIVIWTTYGITLILLVALYFTNRKLSRIYYNSTIQLSERYQIYENRRAINFILPHIVVVSIGVSVGIFLAYFSLHQYVQVDSYIYDLILSFSITMAVLYSFIASKKKKLAKIFSRFLKADKKEDPSIVRNTRVDPMGNRVVINERGADLHFNQLKKAWT